ncbi:MAG TPA: hypothetical protein PKW05_04410 [Anaerolineae bacterium]|nr:hypothetical protein [Anaerolineae bacterium]
MSQYPNAAVVHEVYARGTANVKTQCGQVASLVNPSCWTQVRYIRVETTARPSWVA